MATQVTENTNGMLSQSEGQNSSSQSNHVRRSSNGVKQPIGGIPPMWQPIETPIRPEQVQEAKKHISRVTVDGKTKFRCNWSHCKKNVHGQTGHLLTRQNDAERHIAEQMFPCRFSCPSPGCPKTSKQKEHMVTHINAKHLQRTPWCTKFFCRKCKREWADASPRNKHEPKCTVGELSESPDILQSSPEDSIPLFNGYTEVSFQPEPVTNIFTCYEDEDPAMMSNFALLQDFNTDPSAMLMNNFSMDFTLFPADTPPTPQMATMEDNIAPSCIDPSLLLFSNDFSNCQEPEPPGMVMEPEMRAMEDSSDWGWMMMEMENDPANEAFFETIWG